VEKGITVISNAGGVNPLACRDAVVALAEELGVADKVKVGVVLGDDVYPRLDELFEQGEPLTHMDDGNPLSDARDRVLSANVYLGAEPVVKALSMGANIVISGRVTDTGVTLAPGILYFVADDIAVGGNVLLDVSRSDPDDTLSFGIQPVVAYNVRLTPGVSMLPNGWMAYRSSSIEVFGLDRETRRISVGIELPFLVHLVPHFFIGGGPYASYDLWAKSVTGSTSSDADKVADFGVRSVIGGWF
jgi:hypothetical protein